MIHTKHKSVIFCLLTIAMFYVSYAFSMQKCILDRLSDDIANHYQSKKVLLTQNLSQNLIKVYGLLIDDQSKEKILQMKNTVTQFKTSFNQDLFIRQSFNAYYETKSVKHLYAATVLMVAQGLLQESVKTVKNCPTDKDGWAPLIQEIINVYDNMRNNNQKDKTYVVWNGFLNRILCGLENTIKSANDIILNISNKCYMPNATSQSSIFTCISELLQKATTEVYDFLGDNSRTILIPPANQKIHETIEKIIKNKKIDVSIITRMEL